MKCKSNESWVMGDDAIGNGPWLETGEKIKRKKQRRSFPRRIQNK